MVLKDTSINSLCFRAILAFYQLISLSSSFRPIQPKALLTGRVMGHSVALAISPPLKGICSSYV